MREGYFFGVESPVKSICRFVREIWGLFFPESKALYIAPHWYMYILPATVAGNTVTFTITDGGLGDDDLTPNGAIFDQGGAGAAGIPTLSEWTLILLGLLLAGLGAARLNVRGARA